MQRDGQALLLVVLILATIVVVMTLSFSTISMTQNSKNSEDSTIAIAAAEAGIDVAMQQPPGTTIPLSDIPEFVNQNISGEAVVVNDQKSFFVTPLIQQNKQYTFYLSDYPDFMVPWEGDLYLHFVSESGGCPAIGIAVVDIINNVTKYSFNSCETFFDDTDGTIQTTQKIDSTSFSWMAELPLSIVSSKYMIVKVFNGESKIGLKSQSESIDLPLQGKTVLSEARTLTGITKKLSMFRSYPQLIVSLFEPPCFGPVVNASQLYDYIHSRKEVQKIEAVDDIVNDGIYEIANDVTIRTENSDVFNNKTIVLFTNHKTITIEDNFSPLNSSAALVSDNIIIQEGVTMIRAVLISDESIDPQFITCNMNIYSNLLPYISTTVYERKQI